ncbi:ABC transporter substrate-binding protein [Haloarcula halophila]|uniref:ABC transporter substrate-binding protein n=1 Tax=Haloarcula TaxID=2237 RepID=UPI0023E4550B|nr:ABC transporter substrate-binding protein [Halomicroarcula sp. DFY41]
MEQNSGGTPQPTRREFVRDGCAVLGSGVLAGCSSSGRSSQESAVTDRTPTPTATVSEDGQHTVTMEPVGSVAFESVPETWVPYTGDYADMGVALGQADGLSAIGVRRRFGAYRYEEIPGVSVDKSGLTELWQDGTDKELFYELDADVHVVDPNFMVNRLQWDRGDVEEIDQNVAPWFGNTTFTRVYDWHDYRYYSLYEAFEKVADLFGERARYEAFKQYHDEVVSDVGERLPSERPDVAVLVPAGDPPEAFWPYRIGAGTQSKHWRDLEATDALADAGVTDAQAGGGKIDFETLLEIDPDVIAIRLSGEITQEWVDENVTAHMRDHPIASELTAVDTGRVVYGGMTYQGPIINLFQLETAARGLYPELFGGERLFDRQRIGDIVTGAI